MTQCNKCNEHKDNSDFYKRSDNGEPQQPCKGCRRAESTRKRNLDRQRNPEKWKARERNSRLKSVYGITAEDAKKLWEHQGGRCAICDVPIEIRKARIDHDHGTGQVRGILCDKCNIAIGMLGDGVDGLTRALAYVCSSAAIVSTNRNVSADTPITRASNREA